MAATTTCNRAKRLTLLIVLYLSAVQFCDPPASALEGQKTESDRQTVLVHYMPWYASREFSGKWGWHWTMDKFNPDNFTADGRREAASHDDPLIGLYDSNDPDTLECHVLLMKFSGIDGVIVDWYGIEELWDYGPIHRNTEHLVKYIKKAGLEFAVCYEDQTVGNLIKQEKIKASDDLVHGKQTIKWLDENWFHDEAYVKLDGRPVLLVFGPQYYKDKQWAEINSAAHPRPLFFALPHLSKAGVSDGAFGWPPVHGGKEITREKWMMYLNELYARKDNGESIIAPVFPKFHDIYKEAGVSESHGFIDEQSGKTFTETLKLAQQSKCPLIQIATWNDFGEGTMIEPTESYGYRYLEMLQNREGNPNRSEKYTAADLRLPVIMYQLRKKSAGNHDIKQQLDEASELLFSSECEQARTILRRVYAELK